LGAGAVNLYPNLAQHIFFEISKKNLSFHHTKCVSTNPIDQKNHTIVDKTSYYYLIMDKNPE
jgi:hypothetical protein